jgi:hypothetical protein
MKNNTQTNWLKNLLIGKPRHHGLWEFSQNVAHRHIGMGRAGGRWAFFFMLRTRGDDEGLGCSPFSVALCGFGVYYDRDHLRELFANHRDVPGGGGGYLVASKLLAPAAGVVSGCALLIDYVLTIAISIAAGADALFSVLPESISHWKMPVTMGALLVLTILNLRGVRNLC